MATDTLPPCKTKQWTTKLTMRLCSVNLLAVSILTCLPHISTLTLPSGDPAPGRSPGPPEIELYPTLDTVENQTDMVTEMSEIEDACAFARIPSESESVMTLSETESEVNLTVGHAVFETEQLVRGVVYEVISNGCSKDDMDMFDTQVDDIFSEVIGPVFNMKTPHSVTNSKTNIVKRRMLKLRTLNVNTPILRSDDDLMVNTSVNQKVKARTRNYALDHKPHSTTPPPHTSTNIDIIKRIDQDTIYKLLYPKPQNKKDIENMLHLPIHNKRDFEADIYNETTQIFNQVYLEFQKWSEETTEFRRQIQLEKRDPPRRRVWFYNEKKLQALALYYNITGQNGKVVAIPEDVIVLANQLYYRDRRALERTLGLMAQFIYGAQYKFIYGQKLRARYLKITRYRLGYAFAILENLKQQFYACYFAMVQFKRTSIEYSFEDEVMYLIQAYERVLKIQDEFNEWVQIVQELEIKRKAEDTLKTEQKLQRDKLS